MKHFVMAALLMTGVATFAQAPAKNDVALSRKEKASPDYQLKKLTEDLTLTTKQQGQVKELLTAQEKNREEIKAQRLATTDDKTKMALRDKVKENRVVYKAKMKEILTAEQYTKWDATTTLKRPTSTVTPPKEPALQQKEQVLEKKKTETN